MNSVSPTAHYTSYVWNRNGLSGSQLVTLRGGAYYYALQPLMLLSKLRGGPTIEETLLARHSIIDVELHRLIENGKIIQIVEIASGLSGRGSRFIKKYGSKITYVETDLPDMVSIKKNVLQDRPANHKIEAVDILSPTSLQSIVDDLDMSGGVAVVTEGLVNYFSIDQLEVMWTQLAPFLMRFRYGYYISDMHLLEDNTVGYGESYSVELFKKILSRFVKSDVLLHEKKTIEHLLLTCGFRDGEIYPAVGGKDNAWKELDACKSKGAEKVNIILANI